MGTVLLRAICHPFCWGLKEHIKEMCLRPLGDVWPGTEEMGPVGVLLERHIEQRPHDLGVGLLEAPCGQEGCRTLEWGAEEGV